jgi:hypothetical protein
MFRRKYKLNGEWGKRKYLSIPRKKKSDRLLFASNLDYGQFAFVWSLEPAAHSAFGLCSPD